ncbi:GNAT family acetyltransferase [Microterricola pindariensis]|uniref:GNAT family acetyltransferase n=1 Tax=Microterricola pindariensis TaxID=478010 RepID=A0ABX5ATU3_9MICO|nr:GNAT family acetyltransferase [Microterricola pindariensis]PPL15862.1 GNAT family acetyltransferase [Microterricola pindariensis]
MQIRPFRPEDTDAVIALWQDAGLTRPWNDPRKDIARKATVQPELFVVATGDGGRVLGSVMAGYDGHRGWMNYLAAADDARGLGVGRALVAHVEAALLALGCPKVNLQVRSTNSGVVDFYEHLGYRNDDTVSLGKRLIED